MPKPALQKPVANQPETNPPAPDPVSAELDPKVKEALNAVAEKVRRRAFGRSDALYNDLSAIISDHMKGYPGGTGYFELHGRQGYWHEHLQALCGKIGGCCAEVDVSRTLATLSEKILALEEPRPE